MAGSTPVVGVLETLEEVVEALVAVGVDDLHAVDDAAVWVQASTIGLEATDRVIELARERGIAFVDAPVLGATHRLSRAKTA